MQFSDLIDALKIECPKTPDRAIMVFITHLQKGKVEAGPALLDAYEKWALKRTTRSLPLPVEFLAFYSAPDAEPVHPADEPTKLPDPHKWADSVFQLEEGDVADRIQAAMISGVGYDVYIWLLRNPGKYPAPEDIDHMKATRARVLNVTIPGLRSDDLRDRDQRDDQGVSGFKRLGFGMSGPLLKYHEKMEIWDRELSDKYLREPAA